jgi:hypothetical protein
MLEMIRDLEELMPDATAEELHSGIEMAVAMMPKIFTDNEIEAAKTYIKTRRAS